jgi:hypothetical protein
MLVLLLGITPPGINNSVEYAAYREADTALWYDSGNSQKSGRFQPERVAALNRITRQVYSGMGGSFAPDFPEIRTETLGLLWDSKARYMKAYLRSMQKTPRVVRASTLLLAG